MSLRAGSVAHLRRRWLWLAVTVASLSACDEGSPLPVPRSTPVTPEPEASIGAPSPDISVIVDLKSNDDQWAEQVNPSLVESSGCDADVEALRTASQVVMGRALDAAFATYAAACFPGNGRAQDPGPVREFTEPNIRVTADDEPDFVKTDGQYFYLAAPTGLKVLSAWPPETARVLTAVTVPGTPTRLLLSGDKLVVFARRYPGVTAGYAERLVASLGTPCTRYFDCGLTGNGSQTSLLVFDISDPTRPNLQRRIDLTGFLLAAHRVGSIVHTLVYDGARFPTVGILPENLSGFDPRRPPDIACNPSLDYSGVATLFADLRARNQARIAELGEADLAPAVVDSAAAAPSLCERTYRYPDTIPPYDANPLPLNLMSFVSLDVNRSDPVQVASVVSRSGVAYASPSAFYVGVRAGIDFVWEWHGAHHRAQGLATLLHRFSFQEAAATYAASAVALGAVLDPLAMDETGGALRIGGITEAGESASPGAVITVLATQGGSLARTGTLTATPHSGGIRSVRFEGDQGCVVPLQDRDPIGLLDLANPNLPSLRGQLEVPGITSHVHQVDSTHLLTLGYASQGVVDGVSSYSQVVLQGIDVSDPTEPAFASKYAMANTVSWSDTVLNAAAFTQLPSRGLLLLPMVACTGIAAAQMSFNGLLVFQVGADQSLTELGRISHPPLDSDRPTAADQAGCFTWWTQAPCAVKRSFVVDDYVYSVSGTAVVVSRLDDLAHPVSAVSLDGAAGT